MAGPEGFFVGILELQAADRGLRELAFAGPRRRAPVARARERLEPLIQQVVARGQASGQLRADICAEDVPMIRRCSPGVDIPGDLRPDLWRRYLAIVLDGLGTRRDGDAAARARARA